MIPWLLLAFCAGTISVFCFIKLMAWTIETSEPRAWLGNDKPTGWRAFVYFNGFLFGFFLAWYFVFLNWCAHTYGCSP